MGPNSMHIAVTTMVYNEHVNLPLWIRHYKAHCPGATLFVIDHGSDDGSTHGLTGVNLVALPRTSFDDQTRVEFVADFQHALLRFYDVVIYTDCDEMLVADPRKHASLTSFLQATKSNVIAPIGLNIRHLPEIELPIDLRAAILGQRRYAGFASGMCKPSIARVPLLWVPGFHWCDQIPDYRTDLYQFHLKWMDIDLSLERLRLTRAMAWSERALQHNWARRQRQTDEERIREEFDEPAEDVKRRGAAPFDFETEMKRHSDSLRLHDGLYAGDFFRGPIVQIPVAFFGLI
jgi:hypothetical protein